jgi:hydroxymethylpyrimidine/phosphomethylpyrimidine kinase
LKTFAAHGVYGMSAITALTAQNTREVRAVHAAPPDFVAAQIDAVFEDIGVDAVKIGMLADADLVRAVAGRLRAQARGIPIVLDPVMIAKSGAALLEDAAIEALREELVPLATLVTPNLPELERLTGLPAAYEEERRRAAEALSDWGGPAVLAKGGHAEGAEVVDLLFSAGAAGGHYRFVHPRIATTSTHGTGCTLSSAIAARLGRGETLPAAVEGAIEWLQGAMAAAWPLGSGHGPVNHLYQWRESA